MALTNLHDWNKKGVKKSVGSACGSGDKKISSACGADDKKVSSACGSGDK